MIAVPDRLESELMSVTGGLRGLKFAGPVRHFTAIA
jgi:hypothetical protein